MAKGRKGSAESAAAGRPAGGRAGSRLALTRRQRRRLVVGGRGGRAPGRRRDRAGGSMRGRGARARASSSRVSATRTSRRPRRPHVPYNSDPPTSGPHLPHIAPWGVHTRPITRELQVHNLEDGGVVVNYKPQCADRVLAGLRTIVERYRGPRGARAVPGSRSVHRADRVDADRQAGRRWTSAASCASSRPTAASTTTPADGMRAPRRHRACSSGHSGSWPSPGAAVPTWRPVLPSAYTRTDRGPLRGGVARARAGARPRERPDPGHRARLGRHRVRGRADDDRPLRGLRPLRGRAGPGRRPGRVHDLRGGRLDHADGGPGEHADAHGHVHAGQRAAQAPVRRLPAPRPAAGRRTCSTRCGRC